MELLLLLFILISLFFVSGVMEGYWKRKNTANHWLSILQTMLLMVALFVISNFIFLEWYNILAIPFLRKVPFDYGYMYGAKSDKLFLQAFVGHSRLGNFSRDKINLSLPDFNSLLSRLDKKK